MFLGWHRTHFHGKIFTEFEQTVCLTQFPSRVCAIDWIVPPAILGGIDVERIWQKIGWIKARVIKSESLWVVGGHLTNRKLWRWAGNFFGENSHFLGKSLPWLALIGGLLADSGQFETWRNLQRFELITVRYKKKMWWYDFAEMACESKLVLTASLPLAILRCWTSYQ